MYSYVYIDVSQKQEFIYKNSELKQNLYNSFIIKAVTEKLTEEGESLDDEVQKFLKGNDIVYLEKYLEEKFKGKYGFDYCGGGNSIIRFDEKDDKEKVAVSFIEGYSFKVLDKYPDLELYISLLDSKDIEKYNEKEIRNKLENEKIDELKDKRQARFRRYTYGIEEIDKSGNIQYSKSDNSEENKDDAIKAARKYIFSKFEASLNLQYIELTSELNDYKKQGEGKSYIGVVSIDGNKMGEMRHNIEGFEELRKFSKAIEDIYFEAIVEAINEYAIKFKKEKSEEKLLVTPILQAGDDICLIFEAENAIEIAENIIKNIKEISEREEYDFIREYMKPDDLKYLTACGGVAIARYSYPFFELVKTAEHLCHEAKEAIYSTEAQNGSFINWEIVQSQVAAQYEYEEYVKNSGLKEEYHIKPLRIDQEEPIQDGVFSYEAFNSMVGKIKDKVENNKEISSSFLEGLKKCIYGGKEQYEQYLKTDKESGPELIEEINKIFDGSLDKYMIYEGRDKKLTYIINDVLEALPFMKKPGGGKNE